MAGEFLMYSKDLPSSEDYLLAAMKLDPSYQSAHRLAETAHLLRHKVPEMLALVDSSEGSDTAKPEIHRAFATSGEAGYKQWAPQRVLNEPRSCAAVSSEGPASRAIPRLKMLRVYPQSWFLYGDPEYNDWLKRLGLAETTK